ncbi:hypothetical protein GCM10027291_30170 [Telluribacter humicola]
MTTSQRDAIAEPAKGMVIYNTTLNCLQLFTSGNWICLAKSEPALTYPLRLSTEEIEALPSPKRGDLAYDLTFDCLRVYNGSKWGCSYKSPGDVSPASMAWKAGGTSYDYGNSVAVDGSGNVYITGYFEGSVAFGSTILTSAGSTDMFIVKYSSSGTVLWAQQRGGSSFDAGQSVAVDNNGNAYVTGFYNGTAGFNAPGIGSTAMFVVKYNSSGALQWEQKGEANAYAYGRGITVDGNGNVYVTGNFQGTATFGSTTLISSAEGDMFVAKYSSSGTVQWAQKGGGTGEDAGLSIAVDGNGNVYVAGYFNATATFGFVTLTSVGSSDVFVVKYSSNGTMQWIYPGGGTSNDHATGIGLDSSGNVYIAGFFDGTINFGFTSLTSSGSRDVFVIKINSIGNLEWARQGGGNNQDNAQGIAVDGNGNVYVTGFFNNTATFGSISLTAVMNDMFVVKYSSNGTVQWLQKGGTNNSGRGVATDGKGNTYVTGFFHGTGTYGSTTLTSSGGSDVYVQWFKE